MDLNDKYAKLKEILKNTNGLVTGFSGGVDSSFLVYTAAKVLGERAIAVTARSSTYTKQEFDRSVEFIKEHNIRQIVIESEELDIEGFSGNPPDRCYYCKKELLSKIQKIAQELGITHVADGANADDINDYRPGMKAAAELKVISPLKEAGLTKAEIRELSKEAGLNSWDKPAMACLASRFPYGTEITAGKLKMVENAECFIRELGFRQFRVRHHGDIARIEIQPEEMAAFMRPEILKIVNEELVKIGFTYVALDLKGYRTGSMNETLKEAKIS